MKTFHGGKREKIDLKKVKFGRKYEQYMFFNKFVNEGNFH